MADPGGSSCCRVLSGGRKPGLRRRQMELMAVAEISHHFWWILAKSGFTLERTFTRLFHFSDSSLLFILLCIAFAGS